MSEAIRPLQDRILVERHTPEENTPGKIILRKSEQPKPVTGTVIAVGEGRISEKTGELIPVDFTVGQVVMFGQFAGTEVKVNDKDWVIMREDEVIGVVGE